MANSTILDLTANSSPTLSNLTYLAKFDSVNWYNDRKISFDTLKAFSILSSTTIKTVDYNVTSDECDGRWLSNYGGDAYIIFTLPLAKDELEISFVIEDDSKWIEIKPQSSDAILMYGSAGESMYGINAGSTITLRAVKNAWVVVSSYGTWNSIGSSSSSSQSYSSSSYSYSSSSYSSSSSSYSYSSSSSQSFSSSSQSFSSSSQSFSSSSSSFSSSCSSSSSSIDPFEAVKYTDMTAFWPLDEYSGTREDLVASNDIFDSSSSSYSSSSYSSSSSSFSSSSSSYSSMSNSLSSSSSSYESLSYSSSSSSSSLDAFKFSDLTAFWTFDEFSGTRADEKDSNDFTDV